MKTNRVPGHGVTDPYRDDVERAFAAFGHQTGRYLTIQEQHRALLTEVEQMRLLKRVGVAAPSWLPNLATVRQVLGAAVVRVGEHLQGVRRVEPVDAALREGLA